MLNVRNDGEEAALALRRLFVAVADAGLTK